jgi:hypothetical protein
MATKTGGTKATSTLFGIQFPGKNTTATLSDADVATIANSIIDDADPPTILPGAFSRMGLLYIPRRGVLQMKKGDWAFVSPSGFPYLVPEIDAPQTLTATGDTHTSTLIDNLSTNVLAIGWRPGAYITGTNIPALTTIASIAPSGLSLTLSAAATGSTATQTYTVGSYTHS